MMNVDYRKKYFEHYHIDDPGPEYHIHHIDFNRENNDVDNLLMLPRKLHNKYHMCVSALRAPGINPPVIVIDAQLNAQEQYQTAMLQNYVEVLTEVQKWVDKKMQSEVVLAYLHDNT